MAGEHHMDSAPNTKPSPDPTVATNDAVERAVRSERDYVDGEIGKIQVRLEGMDKATALRWPRVDNFGEEIKKEVAHLQDLMDEKINGIKDALAVAEILRVEQKNDSTTGLAAALSAQKELAAAENTSNKLAIAKSEQSTSETIKTNQVANKATTDALTKSLDEVKLSITRIEATKAGVGEQKQAERGHQTDTRQGYGLALSVLGAVVAVIVLSMSVYAGLRASASPTIIEPITVTTP